MTIFCGTIPIAMNYKNQKGLEKDRNVDPFHILLVKGSDFKSIIEKRS